MFERQDHQMFTAAGGTTSVLLFCPTATLGMQKAQLDGNQQIDQDGFQWLMSPSHLQSSFTTSLWEGLTCLINTLGIIAFYEVTLGNLLSFFTGAEYPPSLGFGIPASVRFNSDSQFPLASTCALELTLPTMYYNNPVLFREKFIYGVKNHGGLVYSNESYSTLYIMYHRHYKIVSCL